MKTSRLIASIHLAKASQLIRKDRPGLSPKSHALRTATVHPALSFNLYGNLFHALADLLFVDTLSEYARSALQARPANLRFLSVCLGAVCREYVNAD